MVSDSYESGTFFYAYTGNKREQRILARFGIYFVMSYYVAVLGGLGAVFSHRIT